MKNNKYFSIMSVAVLAALATESSFAALKATKFPGTFNDVPFSQRVQTKAEGYEPYKDMRAYVIPEFIDDVKKQKKGKKDPNEECPDPNMDEDCECTGEGMDPKSAASGTCKCLSSKASVKNGDCVCNDDPSLDPTKDCAQKLPPVTCPDPSHMDNDCNCLPVNGVVTKPDGAGMCACTDGSGNIDTNLDIDNDCKPIVPPTTDDYLIMQCRTTTPHFKNFMNKYKNTPLSMTDIVLEDEYLECSQHYHSKTDKCFTPCGAHSTDGKINTELNGIIPDFCAGNSDSGGGGHRTWFTNPVDKLTELTYTQAEVDAVFAKLDGREDELEDWCRTKGARWYWYLFAFNRDSNGKLVYYKYAIIGK